MSRPVRAGKEPRQWGVELVPIGSTQLTPPTAVRVRLVDRETGQHIGSQTLPWEWFRTIGNGEIVMTNVANGVHE